MALSITRSASRLDSPFVLAPERYDPRRSVTPGAEAQLLGDVIDLVRETIQPKQPDRVAVVLDTSDAREGLIVARKPAAREIGSAKKILKVGDVIISRLRPYLRQVAYIDPMLANNDCLLLCSTEFFVLRSRDEHSIAFLAPFLLSKEVQAALLASQEGGHHPRFQESTLLSLPVPTRFLKGRREMSTEIERAAAMYRQLENQMGQMIARADASFGR